MIGLCQGPLGQLSDGDETGGVSRGESGSGNVIGRVGVQANVEGVGKGSGRSGGTVGTLATKSVGDVSVSGAGGKGAWAGGEGVCGAERSSTAFFIIRTMSWNC